MTAAWEQVAAARDSSDWASLYRLLSSSTRQLLEAEARHLTSLGVPGCDGGAELLALTLPEYIDLEGELMLTVVEGGTATLRIRTPEGHSISLYMRREGSGWGLDLESLYLTRLQLEVAGTPLKQEILPPSI